MTQQSTTHKKRAISYLRARPISGDARYVEGRFAAQRVVCQHLAQAYGADITREFTAIGGARDPYVRHIVSVLCEYAVAEHADYIVVAEGSGARLLCGTIWDAAPFGPFMDNLISAARRVGEHVKPATTRRSA